MNVSFHNVDNLPTNPEPGGIYMVGSVTKHIVIIDADGNQCSIGTSLYKHTITGEAMGNSYKFSFISTNSDPIDLTISKNNRYIVLAFLPEETMNISLDNIPVVLEQDGTGLFGCTNTHSMDDIPWDSPSFFSDIDVMEFNDTVTEL